jgi:RES domain-containing protein
MPSQSIPIRELRALDTHRLIPTAYAEPLIFSELLNSDDEIELLYELESITNQRLRSEENLSTAIGPDELVFGVNHFRVINAAFSYAAPLGGRFNSPYRGAWYCSDTLRTALSEVLHHKEIEYQEIGDEGKRTVNYKDFLADIAGELHILSRKSHQKFLVLESYVESQKLAPELFTNGAVGIEYPSSRNTDGTNYVIFRPHSVSNVRADKNFTVTWNKGEPQKYTVTEI